MKKVRNSKVFNLKKEQNFPPKLFELFPKELAKPLSQ